jgi:outer membrane protein TolC
MKFKMLFVLHLIMFSFCFNNYALSEEVKKITVENAVSIALANNHDYKIAEFRLKEADEKINAVWGELFPVLESEAAVTKQYAEKGFMSLSDGQADVKFIQLRFGINPGIFYNSLQVSRELYLASREEVKRIKAETEFAVIKSYFSLILAEEMITLRKESIDQLKSNLKDVQNMYSTGSIPKFDLLQAKVQLNSQQPLLLESENHYRTALDYFNYTLGSAEIYKADLSVLEKSIEKISDEDMNSKIEKLTSAALKSRPEIVQIEKKIQASQHKGSIYDSYYLWPTFSAAGYYGMMKSDPNSVDTGITGPFSPDFSQLSGDDQWRKNWQVRVAATYRWGSLFGADSNSSYSREAGISVKQSEEELLKLKRLIAINISSGYSKLLTSYLTIVSQKENVETAAEGVRIARESFRAGVIKNSELLTSELALTSARTGYINSINSYFTALAELKKETGLSDYSIIFEKVNK